MGHGCTMAAHSLPPGPHNVAKMFVISHLHFHNSFFFNLDDYSEFFDPIVILKIVMS